MLWVVVTLTVTFLVQVNAKPVTVTSDVIESCPSPIYCQGKLLDTIQRAVIFNDSKTFVDMSQINDVNVTLENFRKFLIDTDNNPTQAQVQEFVNNNFISENETVSWTPPDFNRSPSFLAKINDSDVREFAQNLVNIWPVLGRKVSDDVFDNPDRHSILTIPNGFIVPGGRFRELYYWDSYWIMKGLLISEMHDTVRGMLENFGHVIDFYGFMPNGARLYYLNRSQPPLFTLMVQLYLNYTNDVEWLAENIQYVETELTFWLKNRTVVVERDGTKYQLAHYGPASNTPRPESYREDIKTCSFYQEESEKQLCYQSLKTGAETGWDFSSRWFFDENGGTNTNLTHIRPQRLVPVDLNSILCRAFKETSNFYMKLGNTAKSIEWAERAETWKKSIEMVLYDKQDGIWYDYDAVLKEPRQYFYPSNFAPLWAEAYDQNKKEEIGRRAATYLVKSGVVRYQGGIPTSLAQTGEQWDFSNAWPPLQEYVVLGLHKTGNSEAKKLAELFAKRWIYSNMKGYENSQMMFEKYDAVRPGQFGGGGEYTVQAGFGWTNGVALSFIQLFFSVS